MCPDSGTSFLQQQIDKLQSVAYNTSVRMIVPMKGVGFFEKQEEKMFIRKAEEKDIPRILELLGQVLQIHADIRPDIFIPGTTKYTIDELRELLKHK